MWFGAGYDEEEKEAMGIDVRLLINFRAEKLESKRFVYLLLGA